jgi:hypothetical protein
LNRTHYKGAEEEGEGFSLSIHPTLEGTAAVGGKLKTDIQDGAFIPATSSETQNTVTLSKVVAFLGLIAAWGWTLFAGGGAVGLLILRGPWNLTHGWFALFSGLSVCQLKAWLSKGYFGVTLSGPVRIAAAILFIVAGRIALRIGL